MVVAIDPETGELRAPTPEELQALSTDARRLLARTGEPTTVETLPNGTKRVRLGPEYHRWSVVRVNPDGTLSFDCVPMTGVSPAPPAPAAPEK
jgi:hypothetical protein